MVRETLIYHIHISLTRQTEPHHVLEDSTGEDENLSCQVSVMLPPASTLFLYLFLFLLF